MPPSIAGRRLIAVSLVAVSLVVASYLVPGWRLWAGPATLAVSTALALAMIAAAMTLWRGSRHRRTVGVTVILVGSALLVLDAAGLSVASASTGPLPYALLLSAATAVAGIGTALRWRGARWLALGLGASGAVSSGLNLSQWMLAGVVDGFGWALSVWTVGSLVILATLSGRDVAARDRLAAHEEVWTRRDPLVRWMRLATFSAIVACPMLLVYAFMQEGAAGALTIPAAALSAFVAVAAFLGGRGQVLGGVLLAAGGIALLALSAAALTLAPCGTGVRIAGYYLVFWLPAAGSGLGCGLALARHAVRMH